AVSAADTAGNDDGEVIVSAVNSAEIDALVRAIAVSGTLSFQGAAPAVAIGVSVARNLIGWEEFGGADPFQVRAYVGDLDTSDAFPTTIDAERGVSVTATSASRIDATVQAAAVAISMAPKTSLAGAGAGVWTDNSIAT